MQLFSTSLRFSFKLSFVVLVSLATSLFLSLFLSLGFAQETTTDLYEIPPVPIGYTSTYTPLTESDCHFLKLSSWDADAPIDYFTQECPAYGGYRIILTGGDLRSWLQLIRQTPTGPEINEFYQDVWQNLGQFPYVSGSVLEWRYSWPETTTHINDRVPELVGLIYRVSGSDPEDLSDRSRLVVVRLMAGNLRESRPCLLGVVNGNEEARALLDTPSTPCFNN